MSSEAKQVEAHNAECIRTAFDYSFHLVTDAVNAWNLGMCDSKTKPTRERACRMLDVEYVGRTDIP
eukprot:2879237-Amphidinium_carterae.1